MIKPLSMIAVLVLTATGVARAEPQGGFPAARERVTKAQAATDPGASGTKKDEVQQRQDAMARRDKALMQSICRGC